MILTIRPELFRLQTTEDHSNFCSASAELKSAVEPEKINAAGCLNHTPFTSQGKMEISPGPMVKVTTKQLIVRLRE